MSSSHIIHLSSNEHYRSASSYIPPETLSALLDDVEFNRYPTQSMYSAAEALAAELYAASSSNVLLCNGSDEGIFLLMQYFTQPAVSSILLLEPSFSMYAHCASILGLHVVCHPLSTTYELSADSLIKHLNEEDIAMIFLPNPHAPTGGMLLEKELLSILESTKAIVVVDEAYIEFTEANSMTRYISRYDNLIVLRTLSKYYGMAALRAGFVISNYRKKLRAIQPPYAVSSLSALVATKVLSSIIGKQGKQYEGMKKEVISSRQLIQETLRQYDFVEFIPSSYANFIYAETRLAAPLHDFLLKRGIETKIFLSDKDAIRITVPNPEDTKQLIDCIHLFSQQLHRSL